MSDQDQKNPRMVMVGVAIGLIGLLLGGGLIVWAFSMVSSSKRLAEHGVRSEALLVEKWIDDGDYEVGEDIQTDDQTSCHFKVRYTPDGVAEPMTAELYILQQFYDKYEAGQDVGVVYLADDPSEIEAIETLENASGSVIGPVIMVIFGVLMLGLMGFGSYLFIKGAMTEVQQQ